MFGLGFWEILLILLVALIVVGPRKLPELARHLGRGLNELQRASYDLRRTLEEEARALSDPVDDVVRSVKSVGAIDVIASTKSEETSAQKRTAEPDGSEALETTRTPAPAGGSPSSDEGPDREPRPEHRPPTADPPAEPETGGDGKSNPEEQPPPG